MCFALFIAAGSLFLGQQQVFPKSWRGSFLFFLPELAIAGLLIFWLCRVLLTKAYKKSNSRLQAVERSGPTPAPVATF